MDVKCKITCFCVSCALLEVGQKKKVWIKSGGSWEVGAQAKLLNIHTGESILLWLSYYSEPVQMNSSYSWLRGTEVVTFPFIFLASVIPTCHEFRLTPRCDPLSFQMNRPIQVKPADSESRGGKRRLSPSRDTAPVQTTSPCTQPKMSTLMSHLDRGPYSNSSWAGEHLKVAPPGPWLYGLISASNNNLLRR